MASTPYDKWNAFAEAVTDVRVAMEHAFYAPAEAVQALTGTFGGIAVGGAMLALGLLSIGRLSGVGIPMTAVVTRMMLAMLLLAPFPMSPPGTSSLASELAAVAASGGGKPTLDVRPGTYYYPAGAVFGFYIGDLIHRIIVQAGDYLKPSKTAAIIPDVKAAQRIGIVLNLTYLDTIKRTPEFYELYGSYMLMCTPATDRLVAHQMPCHGGVLPPTPSANDFRRAGLLMGGATLSFFRPDSPTPGDSWSTPISVFLDDFKKLVGVVFAPKLYYRAKKSLSRVDGYFGNVCPRGAGVPVLSSGFRIPDRRYWEDMLNPQRATGPVKKTYLSHSKDGGPWSAGTDFSTYFSTAPPPDADQRFYADSCSKLLRLTARAYHEYRAAWEKYADLPAGVGSVLSHSAAIITQSILAGEIDKYRRGLGVHYPSDEGALKRLGRNFETLFFGGVRAFKSWTSSLKLRARLVGISAIFPIMTGLWILFFPPVIAACLVLGAARAMWTYLGAILFMHIGAALGALFVLAGGILVATGETAIINGALGGASNFLKPAATYFNAGQWVIAASPIAGLVVAYMLVYMAKPRISGFMGRWFSSSTLMGYIVTGYAAASSIVRGASSKSQPRPAGGDRPPAQGGRLPRGGAAPPRGSAPPGGGEPSGQAAFSARQPVTKEQYLDAIRRDAELAAQGKGVDDPERQLQRGIIIGYEQGLMEGTGRTVVEDRNDLLRPPPGVAARLEAFRPEDITEADYRAAKLRDAELASRGTPHDNPERVFWRRVISAYESSGQRHGGRLPSRK